MITQARRAAAVTLVAGPVLLLGCSADSEAGEPEGPSFDSAEALYEAVDEVLRCPIFDNTNIINIINIALSDGGFLEGLTCGEGMVLAWSEDRGEIDEARGNFADLSEPSPAVQGPGWFVVDAEDSVQPQTGDGPEPPQPDSRDLEALAEELGAEYTEY